MLVIVKANTKVKQLIVMEVKQIKTSKYIYTPQNIYYGLALLFSIIYAYLLTYFFKFKISTSPKFGDQFFSDIICNDNNYWYLLFANIYKINCYDITNMLSGITFGKGLFQDSFKNQVIDLGIFHLLVASGSQISLIKDTTHKLLSNLKPTFNFKIIVTTILVVLFTYLSNFETPILRATIGYLIITLSTKTLGIKISMARSLVMTIIIMLITQPYLIVSFSFGLSCFASIGVIGGSAIDQIMSIKANKLASFFIQNIWIFLSTLPLIYMIQGTINFNTIIVNIAFGLIINNLVLVTIFCTIIIVAVRQFFATFAISSFLNNTIQGLLVVIITLPFGLLIRLFLDYNNLVGKHLTIKPAIIEEASKNEKIQIIFIYYAIYILITVYLIAYGLLSSTYHESEERKTLT